MVAAHHVKEAVETTTPRPLPKESETETTPVPTPATNPVVTAQDPAIAADAAGPETAISVRITHAVAPVSGATGTAQDEA